MATFLDYAKALTPAFLSGRFGQAWYQAHGQIVELSAVHVRDAIKARFPATAETDAKDAIGEDRILPRAPAETDAAFQTVLEGAHDLWARAGTHQGIVNALNRRAFPNAVVREAFEWTDAGTTGTLWNRYWVLIPNTDHAWVSDGTWGSGGTWQDQTENTWDSSATYREIELLRLRLRDWEPAYAHCQEIIVALEGADFTYPSADWSAAGVPTFTHFTIQA